MIKILFVGSNPSEKSTTNTAFEPGTKSLYTLLDWVYKAHLDGFAKHHGNISSVKTPGNRPLNSKEIYAGLPILAARITNENFTHVVALGQTATKALSRFNIAHLALPHPSGLNRKLNDQNYVNQTIEKLRAYIHG